MKRQYEITFSNVFVFADNLKEAEEKAEKFGLSVQYVEEDEYYRKHNNISKEKENVL